MTCSLAICHPFRTIRSRRVIRQRLIDLGLLPMPVSILRRFLRLLKAR